MKPRIRILFLIRSLVSHGAERQLVELVKRLSTDEFDVVVATFYRGGSLESELSVPNVTLVSFDKDGRWDLIGFLFRVIRFARQFKPEIVHGYGSEPNLVALLISKLVRAKCVWGVRGTYTDPSHHDWLGRFELDLQNRIAGWVDLIIYNSFESQRRHLAIGQRPRDAAVVPNGFNLERFHCDRQKGEQFRRRWGVQPTQVLIGIVGRLHPLKDHETFLRAASALNSDDASFICIGDGPEEHETRLSLLARELGIESKVAWAGAQSDMVSAYNGLDILVCCSTEEGTPNVVGEAMACGIACIVSDVGDSARLVGSAGVVISPRDVSQLQRALHELISDANRRRQLGHEGRARIEACYNLDQLGGSSAALLRELAWGD